MQLYLVQQTCMHVTKITKFDWSAVFSAGVINCIYCQSRLMCKLLVQKTCIRFLTQEHSTRFWNKILTAVEA